MTARQATLKAAQLIYFALMSGVALFAAVVAFLPASVPAAPANQAAPAQGAAGSDPMPLLLACIGAGALALVLPALLPRPMVAKARKQYQDSGRAESDRVAIGQAFLTLCVMRAAVVEGFGLLCAVSALVTGELLFLTGAALAVLLMLAMFPTAGRQRDFFRDTTGEEPVPTM